MGFKLAFVMMLLLGAVVGMGYWYYTDTQERMAVLQENNARLEVAVQTQQQAIEQQKQDIALVNAEKQQLQKEFDAARLDVEKLQGKFTKVSKLLGARDIGKLGAANPGVISRIVTNGSNEVMRCFEIASGAPLTEKEQNAEKPSQINKACPEFANPRYITTP